MFLNESWLLIRIQGYTKRPLENGNIAVHLFHQNQFGSRFAQ